MVAGNILTILKDDQLTYINAFVIITGIFLTWGFAFLANRILKK